MIFKHFEFINTFYKFTIYIEGDYAKILGSEFENSSAKTGGAIYLEGDSCNVTGSTFTYSHAYENIVYYILYHKNEESCTAFCVFLRNKYLSKS